MLANAADAIPTAAIPDVEIDLVCKRFGTHTVLDHIELNFYRGDFIALIGPSGCGKSTLLNLIAGLTSATTGEIRYRDKLLKQLGFVFQDANLLPWLNIRDNVALPLKLAGYNKAERHQRAQKMLAAVALSGAEKLYPRQLSGGMRMRASIARALATEPQLLLLDEPFGALDEMTRDDLNEELLRLREAHQWTAAFVTHSVSEAVFLASKVVVLSANPGKIHDIIDIQLPYPRTAVTRSEPEFQRLVAHVGTALHSVRAGSEANDGC